MGKIHAMLRVADRDMDATSIPFVHKDRHGPGRRHSQTDRLSRFFRRCRREVGLHLLPQLLEGSGLGVGEIGGAIPPNRLREPAGPLSGGRPAKRPHRMEWEGNRPDNGLSRLPIAVDSSCPITSANDGLHIDTGLPIFKVEGRCFVRGSSTVSGKSGISGKSVVLVLVIGDKIITVKSLGSNPIFLCSSLRSG